MTKGIDKMESNQKRDHLAYNTVEPLYSGHEILSFIGGGGKNAVYLIIQCTGLYSGTPPKRPPPLLVYTNQPLR